MKAPAMTMCSESRTCQVCISSDDTAYMAKINDGPQIGRFMLDGHEQEMIVWPENDLFCLQPYKWNTFTWVDPRHTAISPQQCRLHLRHVAFELPRDEILNVPCKYSTQNNEHTPEPSSHPMLSSMISCMDDLIDDERFLHIKNVWMIDYELKRANPRPAAQQFCANGLRFVEVTERDGDKWTDRRGDGKDALEYAGWLKDLNTWQDENNPPEFGVLACEEC
ncbi:hypothetical protein LCI18_009044 [Fusarium solani-melongenae]|uniref:Uncharacterized protein n=1 Tax=Fusarium solani subsp. cucurbitae TaxID=2747967 RepID=A0ACD3Z9W8_FUSSC|nr:hypothetical protein LCI18_009044 [Fusarium solani-melongenae]